MAVRLFIGNLPYSASEADLRAHFAPVAEPSHVAMPVDRETGRPRGLHSSSLPIARKQKKSSVSLTRSHSRAGLSRSAKHVPARIARRVHQGLEASGLAPAVAVVSAVHVREAAASAAVAVDLADRGQAAVADSRRAGLVVLHRAPAVAIAVRTSVLRRRPGACATRKAPSRITSLEARSRNGRAAVSTRSTISRMIRRRTSMMSRRACRRMQRHYRTIRTTRTRSKRR